MKDFAIPESLSIPALAVCGDEIWGLAAHKIVDILPVSLQTLNLRIKVNLVGPERKVEAIWMDQMVELVQESDSKLPDAKLLWW